MRCVKEILPPRVRLRWLLMTMRLSAISFAGTARTLVAVGTLSEASMFFAMAAAAPRSCFDSGSSLACGLASAFGSGLRGRLGGRLGRGCLRGGRLGGRSRLLGRRVRVLHRLRRRLAGLPVGGGLD